MAEHAITTDLFPLLIRLADELDKQADTRRQRAIDAQGKYRIDNDEEVERWTVAFSTSYQTLRGVAAALRAVVEEQHDAASAPDSRSRGACVRDELAMIVTRYPSGGSLTAANVVDRILDTLREHVWRLGRSGHGFIDDVKAGRV